MSADAPPVLVTGGTGYIGRALIRRLLEVPLRVRVLVRPDSPNLAQLDGLDVERVSGELRDPESLVRAAEGVDTIFHAGGVKGHDWNALEETNVRGTESLLAAARAASVRRFVLVSDIEVYDLSGVAKGAVIDEDWPLQTDRDAMGPYIFSRLEAERRVLAASQEGLPATIVRPSMVIGEEGLVFFPQLGYQRGDGLFVLVGRGDNLLPLVYVDNLADGIYRASVAEAAVGRIYNLLDDGRITARDYLERFLRETGRQARIVSIPVALPLAVIGAYEIAASLGLVKQGATSRSRFRWKFAPVRFDASRARSELDWRPKVSLDEALSRTFRWYAGSKSSLAS